MEGTQNGTKKNTVINHKHSVSIYKDRFTIKNLTDKIYLSDKQMFLRETT